MSSRNRAWSRAQRRREKISTSMNPPKPASSAHPRILRIGMQPSPIRIIGPPADPADRDAALPHEAAVLEKVDGGRAPVGDVEGEQPAVAAAGPDLVLEAVVPPRVVHVDGDADPRAPDLAADRPRLAQGVHGRPFPGVHRSEEHTSELQ